jgi:hypothetical protein
MRTPKFEYVTVLQANYGYGHGWEDISEGVRKAMRAELATYRANMPEYPYRLINRRNLIAREA